MRGQPALGRTSATPLLGFPVRVSDPDKIIRFGKSRANDAAAELEYRGESGGQMSTDFAPDLDVKGERVSGRASLIDPLVAPVILSHNLPRCCNNPSDTLMTS